MNRLDLVEKASFTVKEIAFRNSVHVSTVNRWLKSGKLKSLKIGGSRRITPVQERQFLGSYEPEFHSSLVTNGESDFSAIQRQPVVQDWRASA